MQDNIRPIVEIAVFHYPGLTWIFNTSLIAKVTSLRSVTRMCFQAQTSTNTTFLSKATDYFSHMAQRWEAKIHHNESLPQPSIERTTTRPWVRHAHHWATRAGHELPSNFNTVDIIFINERTESFHNKYHQCSRGIRPNLKIGTNDFWFQAPADFYEQRYNALWPPWYTWM